MTILGATTPSTSTLLTPLKRLLICNRNEIAVRIARAAKKQGIETIGVYSTSDKDAMYLRHMDHKVHIGNDIERYDPNPSAQEKTKAKNHKEGGFVKPYLDVRRIVDAAIVSNADAVHPGYGFLSENAHLAESLANHNIQFVGPPYAAIKAMGNKIESKIIAKSAGVNLIPGFLGEITSLEHAKSVANEISYPVMIKAANGGGGKGMRIARNDKECEEYYRLCKSEAQNAFGDDSLLVEKFVEKPRHVEIQLLADKHGNVVHFPERECSMQRRNQKVIEESPSPLLDDALRREMGSQAVALAKRVGYESAGTVEFLVSGVDRSFFFLEMNTRLQVEHPITEAVSGVDLAEWMLRIARGEKLDLDQDALMQNIYGHAFEARVYAEDAYRGFFPCNGTIRAYHEPKELTLQEEEELDTGGDFVEGSETPSQSAKDKALDEHTADPTLNFSKSGVRVDSGVEDCSTIGIHYDPLLSKLIVHDKTREAALLKLGQALDEYVIDGITTNLSFLHLLTRHSGVMDGDYTTKLLDTWPDKFQESTALDKDEISQLASLASARYFQKFPHEHQLVLNIDVKEINGIGACKQTLPAKYVIERLLLPEEMRSDNATGIVVQGHDSKDKEWTFTTFTEQAQEVSYGAYTSLVAGYVGGLKVLYKRLSRDIVGTGGVMQICYKGHTLNLNFQTPRAQEVEPTILQRHRISFQAVEPILRAPMAGVIRSVLVREGDIVVEGQEMVCVEAMKMQNMLKAKGRERIKKIVCQLGSTVQLDDVLLEFEKLGPS